MMRWLSRKQEATAYLRMMLQKYCATSRVLQKYTAGSVQRTLRLQSCQHWCEQRRARSLLVRCSRPPAAETCRAGRRTCATREEALRHADVTW